MIFDGRNGGSVELLDNVLVIRRKGVASFLTQGLKGEKRIPYASITSVQFKEAGFTTGYIQFGVAGGIESGRGVWDATTDENTVLFTKDAAGDFRRLRDLVEERAEACRSGATAPVNSVAPANLGEELTRLADLRDRGVLTEEEFATQKNRLLGTASASPPRPDSSNSDRGAAANVRKNIAAQQSAQAAAQPKRGSHVGKTVGIGCLVILGLFVLLAAIGSNVRRSAQASDGNTTSTVGDDGTGGNTTPASAEDTTEDVDRVAAPTSGVTRENFERIRTGMSYDEVVGILGEPGDELSRTELAGTTTVMYQWKAGGLSVGNMNAMFQNGRLVSKAQFGLD